MTTGQIIPFKPLPLRAAQGRKAHALTTHGRVNVFLMPDGRVEIRATYKAAPHGALTVYAALPRHHIRPVRALFAAPGQPGQPDRGPHGPLICREAINRIAAQGHLDRPAASVLRGVLARRIEAVINP